MSKWVIGISTRLFLVIALMLGGWTPVSAHAMSHGAMVATGAMTMMPGMTMHHDGAGKDMPAKRMPCCSDDGCCVAGSCAVFLSPLSATLAERAGTASEIVFDKALGAAITFPPSLRPPIPRA
jgi:hypothetical protein